MRCRRFWGLYRGFHGLYDVLEEELINRHAVFFLVGSVRYAREESRPIIITGKSVAGLAEIRIERRIADDVIERCNVVLLQIQMTRI